MKKFLCQMAGAMCLTLAVMTSSVFDATAVANSVAVQIKTCGVANTSGVIACIGSQCTLWCNAFLAGCPCAFDA